MLSAFYPPHCCEENRQSYSPSLMREGSYRSLSRQGSPKCEVADAMATQFCAASIVSDLTRAIGILLQTSREENSRPCQTASLVDVSFLRVSQNSSPLLFPAKAVVFPQPDPLTRQSLLTQPSAFSKGTMMPGAQHSLGVQPLSQDQ